MKAITKFLAGGVAIAALAVAAPAAAQFFPGMGFPGFGVPGIGYGNPGYGGYGYNVPGGSRIAVSQCTAAVQQRFGGGYGGYGYGYANGGGRVLGITSVEIRNNGGYKVRGTASAGGYAYGGGAVPFSCNTDPRGFVTSVHVDNGYYGQGYYGNGYNQGYYGQGYNNPYGVYGYQRY